MARSSSSARRAALRSGVRSRRAAKFSAAATVPKTRLRLVQPNDASAEYVVPERPSAQRKRIKAARATLRAQKCRNGFGKALRTEMRASGRASAKRARLRARILRRR